jgi:type I restriction enzyme, S subunit
MTYLEKLLDGAGVEWKPLGEVVLIKAGEPISKQIISENLGEYPVINSGRAALGFIDEWNTDNDPIGITTRGAGVGSITWQEGKYFRGNLNYSVSINSFSQLSVRYLYHLLLLMQSEIHALCTFDGIPALNAGKLKSLQIPIPCPENPQKSLAIQAEIVRILDAFTSLTTELTTRKKQYKHYRDQLLTFSEGEVEWKTLGEVGELVRGNGLPKSDFTESGVPAIHYGQIYTYYGLATSKTISFVSSETAEKLRKVNSGDVIM